MTSPPSPLSGAERGRRLLAVSPSPRRRGGWGIGVPRNGCSTVTLPNSSRDERSGARDAGLLAPSGGSTRSFLTESEQNTCFWALLWETGVTRSPLRAGEGLGVRSSRWLQPGHFTLALV